MLAFVNLETLQTRMPFDKESANDVSFSTAAEVIPYQKEKRLKKVGKKWIDNPDVVLEVRKGKKPTYQRTDRSPHLKEGRYLTLKADLTCTLKQLIEKGQYFITRYSQDVTKKVKKGRVFTPKLEGRKYLVLTLDLASERDQVRRYKKLIRQALPYVQRPTTKRRETELNPWEIHDLYSQEKLTFNEITKKKFSRFEKKLLDEEMYKKVQYAYQKAVNMIKAVTPKAT